MSSPASGSLHLPRRKQKGSLHTRNQSSQEFVTEMQACHIVPICADTDENSRNGRTEARVMLCHERASHVALVLQ